MATLVIYVPDESKVERLRMEFEQFDGVGSVLIAEPHSAVSDWPADSAANTDKPGGGPVDRKPFVDQVTLASEASLAEAWLSPEDDHWDDFSKQLCTEKAM